MKAVLHIMVGFVAITSLISGMMMIIKPDGNLLALPPDLLHTTPFTSYLIPGVLLFLFVGVINLYALLKNLTNNRLGYAWSIAGGFSLTVWIIVEISMIHTAHWLQIIFLGLGICIMLLGYQLKGKWAV
jgi:hypothetical protein